jgi:hypothetical protein
MQTSLVAVCFIVVGVGTCHFKGALVGHAECRQHDDLTVRGRIREGPHRSLRAHVLRPGERLLVLRVARAQVDLVAERDEALAERFPDITCPKNTNSHRVCSFCAPRSL